MTHVAVLAASGCGVGFCLRDSVVLVVGWACQPLRRRRKASNSEGLFRCVELTPVDMCGAWRVCSFGSGNLQVPRLTVDPDLGTP